MSKDESKLQDDTDSREKLEADVLSIVRNAAIWARQKIEHGEGGLFMLDKYDPMIRDLLDRQAAITKKEREFELELCRIDSDHWRRMYNEQANRNVLDGKKADIECYKLKIQIVKLKNALEGDYGITAHWSESENKWLFEEKSISKAGDTVDHPEHYPDDSIEIIDKVLDGIDGKDAFYLGNILKYVIRAGKKNEDDLDKANNYAHRLCTGKWRWEDNERRSDDSESQA